MVEVKTQSVPALDRALTLLEALAESSDGLRLSQLAQKLALPRSTTHCLLLTLERRGYLHRNEQTGRYMFGTKLFWLASMALERIALRSQARSLLNTLMEKTRLTVHLATLEGNEAVLIEKVEPLGSPKLGTWIGKRMDLHCTGVGKALLAYLPEEGIERSLSHGLLGYNENTIISARKLREELSHIRRLGYSVDDEEETIGLRCIGAPIFDGTSKVVAAISIAGTIEQITPENLPSLAEFVKQTALAISQKVGFVV